MDDEQKASEDQKRERIFRAAEPLFERYGYRKTTVEDICKAAGISKRTFYELFQDKADVFTDLVVFIAETEMARWERSLSPSIEPKDELLSFMDLHATMHEKRPVLNLVFTEELHEVVAEMTEDIVRGPIYERFRQIIERGKQSGQFRPMDTDAAVWMVGAVMNSMHSVVPAWAKLLGSCDHRRCAEEARTFIITGLLAKT